MVYTERQLCADAGKQRRPTTTSGTPSTRSDPFPAVWAALQAWLREQFHSRKARPHAVDTRSPPRRALGYPTIHQRTGDGSASPMRSATGCVLLIRGPG